MAESRAAEAAPSLGAVVPRWEWRTFGDHLALDGGFTPDRVQESEETYLLAPGSDASVKHRDGLVDVKLLQERRDGLEQWRPVLKSPLPLSAFDTATVVAALGSDVPPERAAGSLQDLVDAVPGSVAVPVQKRRERFQINGCMAELTTVETPQGSTRTIAIESEDPARVQAAVRELRLDGRRNVCVARGLKTLVGIGVARYAVVDVGTNSVKFHVGERRADGTWTTVTDRADVTRLGQGLEASGRIAAPALERTVAAVAAMVREARGDGAVDVAIVGTAALRTAENGAAFGKAVADQTGVEVDVLPGEEEARLAYLAARAELDIAGESFVVFDTGGGSSQFSFGRDELETQFSVPVGAVRLTDRFDLAQAVTPEQVALVRREIAAELEPVQQLPHPDVLVGMGGAVTNLVAVSLRLERYDPDAVQGATLARAEVERQVELYRTRSADERRDVVGLQPNRAEVILAGALVVATVMEAVGRDALTVSDRGLRHGVLHERFDG